MQEVSQQREIEIPDPVRQVYAQWRPSPLFRARRLEKALDTPAKIYYKYEGVSPAGSHKPNTAVAQAYYNKMDGTKRLATETGAGQWGSSLAMACAFFGLECKVYMVRVSYNQKPYRRALMEAFGATVTASPSTETESGRAILAEHPDSPRLAGDRDLRSRGSCRQGPEHQVRTGQRAQSCAASPDRHRPRNHRADGDGRRRARRNRWLHRRRIELRWSRDALPRPQAQRPVPARVVAVEPAACPSLDQGAVRLRLRRYRTPDPAGENAHPRFYIHPARGFTPAACVITEWRHSFPMCSN